jgi:zinc D-Ala-D-Ala dipeptidase
MKRRLFVIIILLSCGIIKAQHDSTIVLLSDIDSTIVQDVKYATADNFTGKVLYPTGKVYLRKIVAEKLAEANAYLKQKYGLRIKIFDGYRPRSVQWKMWEVYPVDGFVANPAKGSKHNRGAAVDITIIDHNGNELEMGTPYDTFSEKAHFTSHDISRKARENRDLLRNVMVKFEFKGISTEWWHFDYLDWRNYSLLDIPIR